MHGPRWTGSERRSRPAGAVDHEGIPAVSDQPVDRPSNHPGDAPGPFIDWDFARVTAARLAAPGPKVNAGEAAGVVAGLRQAALAAHDPVAETSRLTSPPGSAPVLIVDRAGWASANIDSMRELIDPVVAKMAAGMPSQSGEGMAAMGGKITGAETGALLAFFSSKILGQYDLAPSGQPRLLLVAPNIVSAEREMGVSPRDFRLWVAMHEETHRVQFTAVPWLREHMIERSRTLALELAPTPSEFAERVQQIAQGLPGAFRPGSTGLAEVFLTPEQKGKIAEITAVMSLLEGHADVIMDDVGPSVIPTVAEIREKFTQRRAGLGQLDRLIRRLLGLEAKMRQYADGAVFVRAVVDRVGIDGFNAVWTSPQTLPTAAEMADPQAWVARVHG
ncbi:MAG: zinc-dependent metalloprotease [Actinomycetales bacterium]|uniref:Zinc-dependent metalloprotease n=1 Tax=Candidatus Phosphoribacter hodrii TaxID=2953743 RepID=A0A935IP39_9MICO|nr:zinc-dependent metalloprotease [Candidatus Phosphoribacter hodrii]